MKSNRLQLAIARQSRIRRSRDVAWMLFATTAIAALFGWSAAVAYLAASPTAWVFLLLALVFAVAMSVAAYRLFGAARTLNQRLDAAGNLSTLPEHGAERDVSLWSELFPPRGD